ncbi:hypothetical protein [Modestobacter lapidis]|nr:hypothetical protein [Modestobacter lapidis]
MSLLPSPIPWATALISAADGPIPDYGSPEWVALPDNDRRKVAATVLAAECWRAETDPEWRAWRLRTELEAGQGADDEPARWTPEIVAEVHRTANRPSYAELCDRRGEPDRAGRARQQRRHLGLVPSA